uniref:(northern house mosquito) hypothetical protein n=1 Tax=Culex pipiens TaxID=7175 RepID=A0A8D8AE78_CULPI
MVTSKWEQFSVMNSTDLSVIGQVIITSSFSCGIRSKMLTNSSSTAFNTKSSSFSKLGHRRTNSMSFFVGMWQHPISSSFNVFSLLEILMAFWCTRLFQSFRHRSDFHPAAKISDQLCSLQSLI